MDVNAPYFAFVATAYGLFAFVLLGLLAAVLIKGARLKRELAARGLSDTGSGEP